MAVSSDCFVYNVDESLRINPIRFTRNKSGIPQIDLDPKYYGKIDDFEKRFGKGIPSLVDCDRLTIEGDVIFEDDVKIKGSVNIKNSKPFQAVVQKGTRVDRNIEF